MARFHRVDPDGWFVFDLEGGFTVRYNDVNDVIDESEWMSPWQSYGPNEGDMHWNENTASFLKELLADCQEAYGRFCMEYGAYCNWPKVVNAV